MAGNVTELTRKSRKKPPKTPPIEPEEEQEVASPIDPNAVKVATTVFPPWPRGAGKGNYAKIEAVMEYWRSLGPEFINRTNFYVNREKPVLNRLVEYTPDEQQDMRDKKRRYPAKYIDKPAEPWESDDFRMEILRRYGSGDYKIFLNDAGLAQEKKKDPNPDLTSRNLCKCFYSVWDSDYPPILDPSRPDKGIGILDWKHAANASYVGELRSKGIYPPGEKEGNEVEASVVKTLADKVETLAGKVGVQETDRLVERIAERVNPQSGSVAKDIIEAIKVGQAMNPPAAAPAQAADPIGKAMEMVTAIMAMKAENPVADLYKAEMTAIRAEMAEERKESRRLQQELLTAKLPQNGNGNGDKKSRLSEVKDLIAELKDLGLKDLIPSAGAALEAARGGRTTWLDIVRDAAPTVVDVLGKVGMAFAARSIAGVPPNPYQQLGAPQLAPPAPPTPMAAPQNGTSAPQPGPQAAPQQPQQLTSEQRFLMFLQQPIISATMMNYFQGFMKDPPTNQPGDFANWIFDGVGEGPLKDARGLGRDRIMGIFKASPSWPAIAPMEAKLTEFVDGVLAWQPESEPPDEDDDDENGVDLTA